MKKLLLGLCALGVSGMLQAQNPYPILSIDSMQFVNPAKLATPTANTLPDYVDPTFQNTVYRDTVRFDGIVISNPQIYGLSTNRKAAYIQRKGGGPWSGALVMCEPSGTGVTLPVLNTETKFYENFVVGYPVRVTGVIRDFSGETQVNLIRNNANWENSVEQLSLTPDTLVYSNILASELMTGNPNTGWVQQKETAEQWEGTLVRITNVSVYSIQQSGNRTFWSVIDDFGNVLDVRDMSAYFRRDDNEDTVPKIANTFQPPPIGTRLDYIQGVVTEYAASGVQRYGIIPIYPSDYKLCTSCPPIVKYVNRNPIIARQNDTVDVVFEVKSNAGNPPVAKAVLYYKLPSTPTVMDSVIMTPVIGFPDTYLGRIPPAGMEGVLTFWARAEDSASGQTFFPDPLTLGKQVYVTTDGIKSIQQLQYSNVSSGASIWAGDSLLNINVPAVVTGLYPSMLTVQAGTGPNSAIFIQKGGNGVTSDWKVGDSVQITRATVGETFNTTNLYNILGSKVDSNITLPAFDTGLFLDSFALNNIAYARAYEGVLMRFDSVQIFSTNPDGASDFGEFSVKNKNTSPTLGLRVDDLSATFKGYNHRVKAGMMMGFIQGPMYFANGNFKLIPRDSNDADFSQLDEEAPVITLIGNNPDTVDVGSGAYVDLGATAVDNIDGDVTANIVTTGTVNTAAVASYTIKYKVSDAWGNADSTTRLVVVRDTISVGVNENELNFAQLVVFPNPASRELTLSGNYIKTQPVTITVVDLLGKELVKRTVYGTRINETISTESFNNGVYFCTISNASGNKTLKFVVSK